MNHLQSECAETFYNSVACRVLHRNYYNNNNIFWRPALSTEHLSGSNPTYRSYYPPTSGLRRCLLQAITDFNLDNAFQNLRRDIRRLEQVIMGHRPKTWKAHPNHQLQVLSSLFFRNKAAYIVARLVNGDKKQALIIPLMQDARKAILVDTALMRAKDVSIVFSFSRAYFAVDMEVPSAYVNFLLSIMPGKSPVGFVCHAWSAKTGEKHCFTVKCNTISRIRGTISRSHRVSEVWSCWFSHCHLSPMCLN